MTSDQVNGDDNTAARAPSPDVRSQKTQLQRLQSAARAPATGVSIPSRSEGTNHDTEQPHAPGTDRVRTACGNQARHLAETAEGDSPQEKKTGPGPSVREADKKLQQTLPPRPKNKDSVKRVASTGGGPHPQMECFSLNLLGRFKRDPRQS
jgi:hypothetical protein